jgi:hypothetical protein
MYPIQLARDAVRPLFVFGSLLFEILELPIRPLGAIYLD